MSLQRLNRARGIDVAGDSTDLRGWAVLDQGGSRIGRVDDLVFDPEANLVHYVLVKTGQDRQIMWPVSRLHFEDASRAVVLKGITATEIDAMPSYDDSQPLPDPTRDEADWPHRIELLEERLLIDKRRKQAGEVAITKRTVTEPVEEDVTLYDEDLQVSRHYLERPATASEGVRMEGDVIIVPIIRERLVVEKRPFVVEEVHITKRKVEHTEHVSDTLRREELVVDGDGINLEAVREMFRTRDGER